MLPHLRKQLCASLIGSLLGATMADPAVAEDLFEIRQIAVKGNTLLQDEEIRRLTSPYIGKDKGFRDIQMALETLEGAYRQAGFTAVRVITPEQELTGGTLLLEVRETPIAKITVSGNRHFSEANLRATLPSLQIGQTPNARELSENIQLANENPAKQIDVVLAVSPTDATTLEATINVEDEKAFRGFVNADNTGTRTTGRHRIGVALRHSNLWDRDHTATFAYTTSPDKPDGTQMDIYSLGYRFPLYGIGDSIDLFYAKSNIDTPAAAFTLGAFQNLTGKGDLLGLRWNHYFQRQGEWSTKLVAGWDIKSMDTTCTSPTGARDYLKGLSAGCTPYTTRPLSATYTGTWQRPGMAADFAIGAAYNISTGQNRIYNTVDGKTGNDRYSLVAGNRETANDFTIFKLGGSYSQALGGGDWTARVAANMQYSPGNPLPPSEQIGLSGSQAVRGFDERVVASDSGYVVNVELYTPDVAPMLTLPGSLRPLFFVDTAKGSSYKMPNGARTTTEPSGIMSAGMGLRYNYKKDAQVRFDLAHVLNAGPAADISDSTAAWNGQWRGHFNLTVGF